MLRENLKIATEVQRSKRSQQRCEKMSCEKTRDCSRGCGRNGGRVQHQVVRIGYTHYVSDELLNTTHVTSKKVLHCHIWKCVKTKASYHFNGKQLDWSNSSAISYLDIHTRLRALGVWQFVYWWIVLVDTTHIQNSLTTTKKLTSYLANRARQDSSNAKRLANYWREF